MPHSQPADKDGFISRLIYSELPVSLPLFAAVLLPRYYAQSHLVLSTNCHAGIFLRFLFSVVFV